MDAFEKAYIKCGPDKLTAFKITEIVWNEARKFDEPYRNDSRAERLRLTVALRESLKLQTHYAKLLNMHDGGQRIGFESVEDWLKRLEEVTNPPEDKR